MMLGLGLGLPALAAWQALKGWSPLALWPNGAASPGMWISPSTLPASFNDYTGTTPVSIPGTVADTSNPVGLALDIRAGAPTTLGPELVVNGDGSSTTGWSLYGPTGTISSVSGRLRFTSDGSLNSGVLQTIAGLTVGTAYQYDVTLVTLSNPSTYIYLPAGAGFPGGGGFNTTQMYSFIFIANATSFDLVVRFAGASEVAGDYFEIDNISVKEIPGNHMLQATSAARPLESARRNLLTYTEDFGNAAWLLLFGLEKTPNYALAPDGSMTACRLYAPTADGVLYGHGVMNNTFTRSVWAKSNTASNYTIGLPGNLSITVTPTWSLVSGSEAGNNYLWNMTVAAGSDISIWHPQVELGLTATPYQAILTDGSTYSPTGFPYYQKYDGTDDGMATAAFTAGTLTSGMDCMIPVRRDSDANMICGLVSANTAKYFGVASTDYGASSTSVGCGSPSVLVDGASITDERLALKTALTTGNFHILEYQNLDMSGFTGVMYGGTQFGIGLFGARGDIMLFPSTASTADKDAARQYLADKYGVTLP